jgi:hypothetical protein
MGSAKYATGRHECFLIAEDIPLFRRLTKQRRHVLPSPNLKAMPIPAEMDQMLSNSSRVGNARGSLFMSFPSLWTAETQQSLSGHSTKSLSLLYDTQILKTSETPSAHHTFSDRDRASSCADLWAHRGIVWG